VRRCPRGALAAQVLAAVDEHGFVRVSVKDDWGVVFPE
jgi:hypothetical protein